MLGKLTVFAILYKKNNADRFEWHARRVLYIYIDFHVVLRRENSRRKWWFFFLFFFTENPRKREKRRKSRVKEKKQTYNA